MEKVLKRDGQIVDFKSDKITDAIKKASETTKEFDPRVAHNLTKKVLGVVREITERKESNLKKGKRDKY